MFSVKASARVHGLRLHSHFHFHLLMIALAACRDPPREQPKEAPPIASAEKEIVIDASAPPRTSAAEDGGATKEYRDALAEGRTKAKTKDLEGAIAAFSRAVAIRPDDPLALGERAYARIHTKDWEGARADIDKALPAATDPRTQAMLYYNLGLVFEGRGEADHARVAFARSNALRPSPEARKKLDGKSACPARIEKPATKATIVADVSAVWDALAAAYKKRGYDSATLDAKPTGDAAIKKALCVAGCDAGSAWIARMGSFVFVDHAVVPDGGKLALYDLADGVWGICGGSRKSTIATQGAVIHVHAHDDVNVRRWVCEHDDDACMSGCFPGDQTERDWFLDTTKQTVAAVVTQSGALERAIAKETDKGISVEGAGCKENVTLR
jgi:hypothetical protein